MLFCKRQRNEHYKYIICAFIFLLSGTAITNVLPLTYPSMLLLSILLIIPFVHGVAINGIRIRIALIPLIYMFVIPLIKDPLNYKYCISVVLYIILAFLVTKVLPFMDFTKAFVRIILLVTLISLPYYILLNFMNINLPVVDMTNQAQAIEYKFGILFNYLPYQKDRNCGIFWEPGLMATFLIIAYVFVLFIKPKRRLVYKLLLVFALITTKSSAGYALMLLVLLLELSLPHSYTRKKAIVYASGIFVLSVLIFVAVSNETVISYLIEGAGYGGGIQKIFYKLQLFNAAQSQRGNAIVFWIEQFVGNPILGRGVVGITENYVWDTCTCFMFLGAFGVMGFTYTALWIYAVYRLKNINAVSKTIIFCVIFIILNKEPHARLLSTWIILFYLLGEGKKDTRNLLSNNA